MMAFVISLAAKLVGEKFAKPFAIGVFVILAALAFWGLKSCYDDKVVDEARLEENAKAIEEKAEADVRAAEKRVEDLIRRDTEAAEIKEAVENAKAEGRDPRAAYYKCVRLQQTARKAGRPAPAC